MVATKWLQTGSRGRFIGEFVLCLLLLVGHRIGCGKIAALARGLRVGGLYAGLRARWLAVVPLSPGCCSMREFVFLAHWGDGMKSNYVFKPTAELSLRLIQPCRRGGLTP